MSDFGSALIALKAGNRVARAGWNGKGMWLVLVGPKEFDVASTRSKGITGATYLPWIGMKTADGCFVPWLASQSDMLSEDWCVLGVLA